MTKASSGVTPRFVAPSAAAPGERPLDPVRRFVNSRLIEEGSDELCDTATAAKWFAAQGYGSPPVEAGALEVYREVRECARGALRLDQTAVAELSRTMGRYLPADPRITLGADGLLGVLALDDTLSTQFAPLQWILASLWRGAASGELDRLKICADERCQISFYDRSRNRSRSWCTSGGCGNRARVARHRARQRAAADA